LVTDLNTGESLYSRKEQPGKPNTTIEGITQDSKKRLAILTMNSERNTYQVLVRDGE